MSIKAPGMKTIKTVLAIMWGILIVTMLAIVCMFYDIASEKMPDSEEVESREYLYASFLV